MCAYNENPEENSWVIVIVLLLVVMSLLQF